MEREKKARTYFIPIRTILWMRFYRSPHRSSHLQSTHCICNFFFANRIIPSLFCHSLPLKERRKNCVNPCLARKSNYIDFLHYPCSEAQPMSSVIFWVVKRITESAEHATNDTFRLMKIHFRWFAVLYALPYQILKWHIHFIGIF